MTPSFAAAILLYAMTHMLRVVRIFVLSFDLQVARQGLVRAHLISVLPALFIPFKLGEVIRLGLFLKLGGPHGFGLQIWTIERFFDAIVIIVLVAISIALGVRLDLLILPLLASTAMICAVVIVVIVKRELYPLMRHYLVHSSRSSRGLLALNMLGWVADSINSVEHRLSGRSNACLLITIGIWLLEVLAAAAFIGSAFSVDLIDHSLAQVWGPIPQPYHIWSLTIFGPLGILSILIVWRRRKRG